MAQPVSCWPSLGQGLIGTKTDLTVIHFAVRWVRIHLEHAYLFASIARAINFTSGYIQRASDVLPKQGSKKPWKLHQNYALDLLNLRFARVDDGTMEFTRIRPRGHAADTPSAKKSEQRVVASPRSAE